MLRSGRGNGHFNAALPFAYIHTVIPAPYDGTVRIWDLDEYREVGGYGIITHINLSGTNFELAIFIKKTKKSLKRWVRRYRTHNNAFDEERDRYGEYLSRSGIHIKEIRDISDYL